MRVCIDAGHGGKDPGAVHGGIKEKDLNLKAALKLKALLQTAKVDVLLSREGDNDVALGGRTGMANAHEVDLFISIHANASPSALPYGVQTYIYSKETRKLIGDAVQAEMEKVYNQDSEWNRVIDGPGLYVLKRTKCPAILIEMGFMTNKADLKKLTSEKYIPELMQGVAKAVSSLAKKN